MLTARRRRQELNRFHSRERPHLGYVLLESSSRREERHLQLKTEVIAHTEVLHDAEQHVRIPGVGQEVYRPTLQPLVVLLLSRVKLPTCMRVSELEYMEIRRQQLLQTNRPDRTRDEVSA